MKNKKIVLILVTIIVTLLVIGFGVYFFVFNTKKEKINVYLFWGNGCPHCENAKEYFNSIEDEYGKYYNLIEYEVWYERDNYNLMVKVSEELEANGSGVPFIVIGDEYFRGYAASINEKIQEAIVSQYENSNYVDIIEKVK